jgi:hypothetical protein
LRNGSQGIDSFPTHEEARGMVKVLWYAGAKLEGRSFSMSKEARENLEVLAGVLNGDLSAGNSADPRVERIVQDLAGLGLKPGTEQWKGAADLASSARGIESNVMYVGVVIALLDPSNHQDLIKDYLNSSRAENANGSERPMLQKVKEFYDGNAQPLVGWQGLRMRLDVE